MKLFSKTVLLSFISGLMFSNADDPNAEENSGTAEFSNSTSATSTSQLSPVAISSATTSSSTLVTAPLPSDADSWELLRQYGKVFVDKTSCLEYLLNRGKKLFFFTRPRRFGKSLFVNMLKNFFRGEQSLFKGTKIYKRGNIVHDKSNGNGSWIRYPVIHIDFSSIPVSVTGTVPDKLEAFKNYLKYKLKFIAKHYKIDHLQPNFRLTDLIQKLQLKFNLPVIILVDEYDCPINIALHEEIKTLAEGLAKILSNFYLEIEQNAKYLGFVWVTGIIKLGLSELESSTSSFTDVTLEKELATAAGFTEDEIKSNFKSHMEVFSKVEAMSEKDIMNLLIKTYDGYRFSLDSEIRVFNPISVIHCLREKRFENFWCSTGRSNYIIRRFWEEHYTISSLQKLKSSRKFLFRKRDIIHEGIPLQVYMLLTGYLTIYKYDKETDLCELTFANTETERKICEDIRSYVPSEKKPLLGVNWLKPNIGKGLLDANISIFIETLNRIGFPNYVAASNDTINEKEVTRRLIEILQTALVLPVDTQLFFRNILIGQDMEADIDITTDCLPINYVIEIKCGIGRNASLLDGIKQQIEYVTKTEKKRISFTEALRGRDGVYLLTIHFNETYGGHIDEWVFLPFERGKLKFVKMKASSEKIIEEVKTMKTTMNIDPKYISDDLSDVDN